MSSNVYQDMFNFVEVLLGDATVDECFWDLVSEEDENGLGRMLANCEGADAGASKIVFTFDEFPDYVIKIPNPGEAITFQNEEDNYVCWYSHSPYSTEDDEWNYCTSEVFLFREAKVSGVDDFFAELIFLGKTKGGVPVYAQKRYKHLPERFCKNCYDCGDEDSIRKIFKNEDVSSLIDFIKKWDIDDLYFDNFGITDEGKPIIIDYAGFWD